ncbi:3'-5' exonuclease [Alcanivorax sp.]|jgi:DNA polymerase III epsilon subunit-like protein|uniref:3'-5' exonuclease n=1 Tax=Alcanivorax sp. TaxID=1872427 RepID=UPI000C3B4549|nr:3'-5' exonuclease [Alcanivorax sp.]MBU86221.1 DNA polymerase III subunit epsilon [Alcanivorax sp.]MCK5919511.1 3'-5' exonuclease [Methylococcales bacterium]|tara:strand:+ start:1617 stop:2168 length:552 start_codon:yes stop_codon:yes gene_type:complete
MVPDEMYISVDIETSGPVPGEYSMLSIGACVVGAPQTSIYLELKPSGLLIDQDSVAVTGLDLVKLEKDGLDPVEAMHAFDEWLESVRSNNKETVFVGLNAPFDWSFINYYFHKYMNNNPFGFTAVDIKAYFMGVFGCSWKETRSSKMAATLRPQTTPNHHALSDAIFQAELFELLLRESEGRR